jgi:hypothetical protein
MNGKWIVSKPSPQAMREQELDNIKNSTAICSTVRDEPAFDSHYSYSNVLAPNVH